MIVAGVSSLELHSSLRAYGHAYRAFGISLSITAYVSVVALFWAWVATVMGTYWERKARSSAVPAIHELSTDVARAEVGSQ